MLKNSSPIYECRFWITWLAYP